MIDWSIAVTASPYRAIPKSRLRHTIYIQTRVDRKSEYLGKCIDSIISTGYVGRLMVVAYDPTGLHSMDLYSDLMIKAHKTLPTFGVVFNSQPDVAGFVQDASEYGRKKFSPEEQDEVAIFMNDDVVFESNPDRLFLEFDKDRTLGVAAAASSDKGTGILFKCYQDGINRITPHVDNHCWAIRTSLFKSIGYPERTGHWKSWFSNIDYCYRARSNGKLVKAIGLCKVTHFGGAEKNPDPHAEKHGIEWLYRKYKTVSKVKEVLGE